MTLIDNPAEAPARYTLSRVNGRYMCPHADCQFKGASSPWGVVVHLRRKHGEQHVDVGQTFTRKRRAKEATPLAIAPKRRGRPPAEERANRNVEQLVNAIPQRPRPHQTIADEAMNYCPRCGDDLGHIREATGGIAPTKCPACKLQLATVRIALSPDMLTMDVQQVEHIFATITRIIRH